MGRAQDGDLTAFSWLAEPMYPRLHRVAYSIMGDLGAAEDATQQAMVRVWQNLPQLRDPECFESWCFQSLVNECRREWRRRRRWRRDSSGGELAERAGPDPYVVVDDREALERAFDRLSLEQRTVLVLFHYADMSHEAIADALGIAVGTARSRLHRAHGAMRAALEADARPATLAHTTHEVAR
ncbi:MAG: RNA polymerase sigma factor [Candidatus Limnocylindrales bacterium]